MAETGGWPLLVARFGSTPDDDDTMRQFLIADILRPLATADLVNLGALMSGRALPGNVALPLPLARRDEAGGLTFAIEAIRRPLAAALEAVLGERLAIPAEARATAEAHAALGQVSEAILTFQRAGFFELALRAFAAADGRFFIYQHGPHAFDRVLAGFPSTFAAQSETIVMSLALQALKRGDLSLARRVLADRFGDAANDLGRGVLSAIGVFARFPGVPPLDDDL